VALARALLAVLLECAVAQGPRPPWCPTRHQWQALHQAMARPLPPSRAALSPTCPLRSQVPGAPRLLAPHHTDPAMGCHHLAQGLLRGPRLRPSMGASPSMEGHILASSEAAPTIRTCLVGCHLQGHMDMGSPLTDPQVGTELVPQGSYHLQVVSPVLGQLAPWWRSGPGQQKRQYPFHRPPGLPFPTLAQGPPDLAPRPGPAYLAQTC